LQIAGIAADRLDQHIFGPLRVALPLEEGDVAERDVGILIGRLERVGVLALRQFRLAGAFIGGGQQDQQI
jgi:hypothetical protein